MSVTSCTLIDESSSLVDGKYSYKGKYEVVCDTRGQSTRSAMAEAQSATPDPLPLYFASYSLLGTTDVNALCKKLDAKRANRKNASRFFVDVEWSVPDGDPDNDQTSDDDPLLKPILYWGEFEDVQVPVEEAWNVEGLTGIGRTAGTKGPIQNAAGQEPSSPIMQTVRLPVLVAEKNYTNLSTLLQLGSQYANAVSSDTFFGAAAENAAYRGMSISRPQFQDNTLYYTVAQRVAVSDEGWNYAMVNRGFKFLEDDDGTKKLKEAVVEDSDGNFVPASEPINLELDGTPTAAGSVGTVINWRTQKKLAFSGLGIGGGA